MRAFIRLACVLLAGVLAARAVGAPTSRPADQVRLTFLHINDVHGQLEGTGAGGGYARLASAVDDVRKSATADRVFLIHAGDEFSRGDDLTTRTHGRANIDILNHLGIDFWTPGNGDFYDGLDNLVARIEQARFKTLASNMTLKPSDKPLANRFVIEEAGAARIAFLGLCFIHEGRTGSDSVERADPIAAAKAIVPELRKQADFVVAVNHIGFAQDQQLAGAVDGIDLIIGGHSHTVLRTGRRVKGPAGHGTLIVQAGEHLNYMGQVDVTLKLVDGKWRAIASAARLIALDQQVKQDPAVKALIARLSEQAHQPARPRGGPVGVK